MTDTSPFQAYVCHQNLPRKIVNRTAYILSQCEGKRVLHIGCAGYHSGDWEEKIRTARWLHGKIGEVATEVVGIDNASEAVEILNHQHGIRNVFAGNAECLDTLGMGTFDVVIAGEIIEHMPCPGNLLRSCHSVLRKQAKLIITTTNAYCLRRFLRIPFGKESIHSDHVAYYSHRTLQKLSQIYEYRITDRCSYRLSNTKPLFPYLVERLSSFISPNLAEGIIIALESNRCMEAACSENMHST